MSSVKLQALGRFLPAAGVVLTLLVYAALKLYGARYAVGDENIYFYMAERTRHGALPYRDFFFAHPPLHLVPAMILFALTGGFSLAAGKLLPAAAAGLAGVFVYRLARRLGPWEGVLACAFFLLSYDVLRASSHFTGTNLAVMWAALGMERLAAGKDRQSAAAFSCGAFTAIYAAPTGVAAGIALFLADPKRALRFARDGLLIFFALNFVCALLFGGAFFDEVYLYHLNKPEAEDAFGSAMASIFFHNAWLLWGAAVGLVALALEIAESAPQEPRTRAERRRNEASSGWWTALRGLPATRPALVIPAVALAINMLFLAGIARVFHFYFQLVFACAAPLCGYGLASLGRRVAGAFRERAGAEHAQASILKAAALVAVLVSGQLVRSYAYENLSWSKEEGETSRYAFSPAGLAPLDAAARPLFWSDERVIGRGYWEWTYYLWHESRDFNAGADRLTAEVRARSSEGDTIFGDSTTAPLIALLAGRRLALDEADTNVMRFRSGTTSEESLLARLDAAPPRLIIASPRRGIYTMKGFRAWADAKYETAFTLRDPVQGTYLLLARR